MGKLSVFVIAIVAVMVLFQNCSGEFTSKSFGPLNAIEFSIAASDQDYFNFNGHLLDETRSLMIIENELLDEIYSEGILDVGVKLGEVSQWQSQYLNFDELDSEEEEQTLSPGPYVRKIFKLMNDHQRREIQWYANNPDAHPVSHTEFRPVPDDRRMAHVIELWENHRRDNDQRPTFLNNIESVSDLAGGPFRLLAIVNRMDLAGDYDPRTQDEITRDPRSLGEFHIIFSVVDVAFESENQRPYPKVFALKYRIPPLHSVDGRLTPNDELDHKEILTNRTLWRNNMQIWAKQWAVLSSTDINSQRFKNKLSRIINWSTRAQDFLSLQVNTQIYGGNGRHRDREFEMASWYVFTGGLDRLNGRHLIPRSLRREPYFCMNSSEALADLVTKYWVNSYQDLDMMSRRFDLGLNGRWEEDKAGYEVLRDSYRAFMEDYAFDNEDSAFENKSYWRSGTCGTIESEMPHMMHREGLNNSEGRVMMLPHTVRVKGNGPSWTLDELRGTPQYESKRHAFAIRTCSGCHSSEGATRGFHVHPRLSGENSKLSPFLTGNRERLSDFQALPWLSNTFRKNGQVYEYNELQDRKVWLNRFLRKTANPKRSLLRPETHR